MLHDRQRRLKRLAAILCRDAYHVKAAVRGPTTHNTLVFSTFQEGLV
jgi:hypothetical protein